MRWLVEVSSLGKTDTQKFCVDAESWQRALQSARSQRGEDGPMSGFSIELLEEGYRAVDPLARVRFVVKRAPDDMALTPVLDRPSASPKGVAPSAPSSPSAPPPAVDGARITHAASSGVLTDQTVKNLPATPGSSSSSVSGANGNGGGGGGGNGKKSPSIPVPRPGASQPPPAPSEEKKVQTMAFGTGEVAVVEPAVERAPPPAVGSSIPGLPAVKLLTSREQNPNDASPLTYREYAFAVPEGTSEEVASDVLRAQLRYVEAHIATAKMGKLVNLACFDVEFTGKPPRPPLATLTWKDWKGEPALAYPRRGEGASKPPRPPSQMPASLEARALEGAAPIAVPPAAPIPQEAAFPVTQTQPMGGNAAAQVATAQAQAEALAQQQQQAAAAQQAAAQQQAAADAARQQAGAAAAQTALAAQQAEAQKQAALQQAAMQQQQAAAAVAQQQQAAAQQQVAQQAAAQQAAAQQAAAQQAAAQQAAAQAQPQFLVPEPTFTEAEPSKSPSHPPPGGMVKTPSGRFVRGRVSGDELITSLFESMHDLHFLRDALDGGQFCLALATEVLPARAALIHFFDIEKREWVVACTRGKETNRLLTMRSPDGDEILREAARKRRALVVPNASNASADRYRQIGGGRSLIVAPIMQAGRALGALEIINPLDGMPFTEDEGNAMTYIAEQFAEYLGSRGIVLDRDRIQNAAAAR